MTDATATSAEAEAFRSPRRGTLFRRASNALIVGVAIVALADYLFYQQEPGINILVFVVALATGVLLLRGRDFPHRQTLVAGGVLVATLLPLVEAATPFSALSALAGLAIFALAAADRLPRILTDLPAVLIRFGVLAPVRLAADSFKFLASWHVEGVGRKVVRTLLIWIVPAVFALIFLILFASANPVIEWTLERINLDYLLSLINIGRILFWSFMLSFAWPFLLPRLLRWRKLAPAAAVVEPVKSTAENLLFGEAAIVRSLIVFNAMFAAQTVLDIAYLWGGVALPDGMTYAAYAHRGAYPLIVTALLAAGFVLAAMRKGGPGERSRLIRVLVYLWIAQNIWLVISSILRLDLYVQTYSLTELRIAAGIWMGLVAIGLVLILARIATRKSNKWLVSMNLLSLGLTLYACGFVDFAAVISRFNVEHSYEMTGKGAKLDGSYLMQLGPGAIPAIDLYLAAKAEEQDKDPYDYQYGDIGYAQVELLYRFTDQPRDWRNWSFRDWRLGQYIAEKHPFPFPPRDDTTNSIMD